MLAAGAKSGMAHAIRESDGSLLWTRRLGQGAADGSRGIHVNTAWSGKHLLMACNGDPGATLYALDGATGDVVWMRELPSHVWGRMSVANGVGFAGVGETLDVFDVDTGEQLGVYPGSGGTLAGSITVANGRVAFGEGLRWSNGQNGTTLTVLTVP